MEGLSGARCTHDPRCLRSMKLSITELGISGVLLIEPSIHADGRGRFIKSYHAPTWAAHHLPTTWPEQFWSTTARGIVRGLHFQIPPSDQRKAVSCLHGAIFDVIVDLRRGSSTEGRHIAVELTAGGGRTLLLPTGVAHGFQSLIDGSLVHYSVSAVYSPVHDLGVRWDSCGIPWPLPIDPDSLSARDRAFPALQDFRSPFCHG